MPSEKPTFFTKVLQTLRKLSTLKGFSIKQITSELQRLGINRNLTEMRSIVEKSLKYGVQKKLLHEKRGKYYITAARLRSLNISPRNNSKRVRFKKSNTSINDVLRKSRRKSHKTSKKSSKNRKYHRSERTETPPESEGTTEPKNPEKSPSERKSNSTLIVTNEDKEPLEVSDRDSHDNCVNKKRNRGNQPSLKEPPGLGSDSDIDMQPQRPPNRLNRHTRSKHTSKLREDLKHRYKHCSHRREQRNRLKDLIPDDKMYRKYKRHSRHHHHHHHQRDYEENANSGFKEKTCRKCRHHKSKRHCHHRSHHNCNDILLERKKSNTLLDHLNKSKTVLDNIITNVSPFQVFLEANHGKLETIPESVDDPAEEVENERTDNGSGPSYI